MLWLGSLVRLGWWGYRTGIFALAEITSTCQQWQLHRRGQRDGAPCWKLAPSHNAPQFTDVLSKILLHSTVQVQLLHSTLIAKSLIYLWIPFGERSLNMAVVPHSFVTVETARWARWGNKCNSGIQRWLNRGEEEGVTGGHGPHFPKYPFWAPSLYTPSPDCPTEYPSVSIDLFKCWLLTFGIHYWWC